MTIETASIDSVVPRLAWPRAEGWLPWIFRAGVAGCFIGHGAFGIIGKEGWLPYFAVAGIDEPLAWRLMPVIGLMDVLVGVFALLIPVRGLLIWAAIWAAWTALLRPLAGEPFWETLERAGNYGVPLAWLAFAGWRGGLFRRLPLTCDDLDVPTRRRVAWVLRIVVATLLIGHAGCGWFIQKPMLAQHYAVFALAHAEALVPLVGAFEFLLAAWVLVRPTVALLLGVCLWKLATELLFPLSGAPWWEFVERYGSYASPLALALILSFPEARANFTHPPEADLKSA